MQYDVKLIKLVSGETVMGNYDEEHKVLNDVVVVQTVPTGSGTIQLAILPYGFPYEQEIIAKIDEKHFLYVYNNIPGEMKNKYLEAKSNIKIAPAGSIDSDNGSGIVL